MRINLSVKPVSWASFSNLLIFLMMTFVSFALNLKFSVFQLHSNKLTTLPNGLIFLNSLTELSLRDNPLVVRFVRQMDFQVKHSFLYCVLTLFLVLPTIVCRNKFRQVLWRFYVIAQTSFLQFQKSILSLLRPLSKMILFELRFFSFNPFYQYRSIIKTKRFMN